MSITAASRQIFSNRHIFPGEKDVGVPAQGSDEEGRQW